MMEHFYHKVDGYITTRHLAYFQTIIRMLPNHSVWAEVGSWKGQSICYSVVESHKKNKQFQFYCVDTWQGSPEQQALQEVKDNKLYEIFSKNIDPIKAHITPIQGDSADSSKHFDDQSVDFVYIDADHQYESVKKDLESWYPKIKQGGILGGDDYKPKCQGVWNAVNDFIAEKKLPKPTRIGRAFYLKV